MLNEACVDTSFTCVALLLIPSNVEQNTSLLTPCLIVREADGRKYVCTLAFSISHLQVLLRVP